MQFARMSHQERLDWMKKHTIETPDVKKVITYCRRLYRQAGTKREGNVGFVMGDTGVGKSTAVAAFVDQIADEIRRERPEAELMRPEVEDTYIRPIWEVVQSEGDEYRIERPVVVVVVPPRPQFNPLLGDVAAALGKPLTKGFKFGEALRTIKKEIRLQNVKMMIFDEVQHITQGSISSYQAADVIKVIAKCKVEVVCVGMPDMMNLVEGQNANEQLQRLKRISCEVRPLACSLEDFFQGQLTATSSDDIRFPNSEFKDFCARLDDRSDPERIILPFDEPSDISNALVAIRLWRACWNGRVGKIMDFLGAASDLAIEKKRRSLTLKVMEDTYRQMGYDDCDNWFMMDLPAFAKRFDEPKRKSKEDEADGEETQSDNRKPARARNAPRKRG